MTNQNPAPSSRILSLDALRGFDMFWIVGGGSVIESLLELSKNPFWNQTVLRQFSHVGWEGFRAWDLIMPLFLFIVGTAMPFSFGKRLSLGDSKAKLYLHIFKRCFVLFILGLVAQGHLLDYNPDRLVLHLNTLHAIAAGYLVSSILLLHFSIRKQILLTLALLVGYWAILVLIPVPGHGVGTATLTRQDNLAIWLDHWVFEKLGILSVWESKDGSMRPLSTLTFGANVMLGVFAAHLLKSNKSQKTKAFLLAGLGIGCLLAGWIWGFAFPIIKRLWTSSFVLYAGGWSFLLLALFYWIIDVKGYKKWAFVFTVIGMNAIAAYMAAEVFNFHHIGNIFVGGLYPYIGPWKEVAGDLGAFVALWLILWWMYRKKSFIRI